MLAAIIFAAFAATAAASPLQARDSGRCQVDADCPASYYCDRADYCQPNSQKSLIYPSTTSSAAVTTSSLAAQTCQYSSQCPSGSICNKVQRCQTIDSLVCQSNDDCAGTGHQCVNGLCQGTFLTSTSPPASSTTTTSSAPASSTTLPAGRCHFSSDCGINQYCDRANYCQPDNTKPCQSSSDCFGPGSQCVNGLCQAFFLTSTSSAPSSAPTTATSTSSVVQTTSINSIPNSGAEKLALPAAGLAVAAVVAFIL